jgi:large subunit ribosomal protein L17
MRHHNKNKKFGRQAGERTALLRSLTVALIAHGKIQTTEARAKSLRPRIERLITKAREADIAAVRTIKARLGNDEKATNKLVKDIAPKYKGRAGGYTRITKIGQRAGTGDAASMAVIELV